MRPQYEGVRLSRTYRLSLKRNMFSFLSNLTLSYLHDSNGFREGPRKVPRVAASKTASA